MILRGEGLFGSWLSDMMHRNNLNTYTLSEEISMHRETISKHIHKHQKPYMSTVKLYADYFDVDFWELYGMIMKDWSQK